MFQARLIPGSPATCLIMARLCLFAGIWALWETAAASGLFFDGVVPSSVAVSRALGRILSDARFYGHLGVTATEIAAAMAVGGGAGAIVGIALGGSRFLGTAYEPWVNYLGPMPKIILLPMLVILFGTGVGSKIAMGAVSCFFPVALSLATAMRQVDAVLVNVGRSFRLSRLQLLRYIYMPSLVLPMITGVRLGLGLAIIGVLLAETKLSKAGLGFLVIQSYNLFHIPEMYAYLILVFGISVGLNLLLGKLGGPYVRTR